MKQRILRSVETQHDAGRIRVLWHDRYVDDETAEVIKTIQHVGMYEQVDVEQFLLDMQPWHDNPQLFLQTMGWSVPT
jgi:hypothetical protein